MSPSPDDIAPAPSLAPKTPKYDFFKVVQTYLEEAAKVA